MKKVSEFNLFRAFRSRNYTLYFIGRAVSQFGTWMQRTAVVWLVYSLTQSAFLIGMTIFCEIFPSFLFSVAGGVAADRYDRYRIIRITQVASMIQSVGLAALAFSGHNVVWAILVLSVLLGIINAFDVPARQSLINDVVADKADLPNALALTTATASLAQLLGPALAGIVLSTFGAPICFLLNAATFGAVIVSLLLMTLPAHQPKRTERHALAEFAEGFRYLTERRDIGTMILMLGIVSLLVLPYNTVLPIFAKVIFKGDASTFGYINSFVGVGSVVGTIYLASRSPQAPIKKILLVSTLLLAGGLIAFAETTRLPLALFWAVWMGFGSIAQYTVSNIFVQSESAPHMRGRVIGILLMAIFGMIPLGSLLVGAVSERIGAPATVLGQGIIASVVAVGFAPALWGKPGRRR
ncbi:MAG TPA: MFS transporter [Puia sp.]|uniref:MFS transporter n=1 Tax=Puia sp. TaxID=2045100 RepID=UPI002BF1E2A8|nr:MFS transporter [Puia sp.]HVU95319.1 MFS transporter [Puia sp.]